MKRFSFWSERLKRDQDYYFYVTEAHDEIDVLFVQDGEDYLQLGNMTEVLMRVCKSGFAIILVPPGSSLERYHFYHPDGRKHQAYLEFFYEELIPQVEKIFSEKRKRIQKMGLLGDSLAGAVNLSIAAKEPKRWTHLLFQSAAFSQGNFEELEQVIAGNWNVYQMVGQKEEVFVSPITGKDLEILAFNRRMKETLLKLGANVTYFEENTEHLWDVWQRDLPRALSYFLYN